ncbi:flocculation protein FLO11-like [Myzus persicae]|uniref:flocculation protein FLO11-like n=1 Tax=Myzus persicae TaxID=13164 RepID=UPI000B936F39|nr:flocculation protein FLO11-like [Myzus persicae]
MATTMFQAVVLGLFIASSAFADVIHLKNVKPCHHNTQTQNTNDYGNLASASGDHANVAYSHPPAFSFGAKSFGISSTSTPFAYGTQPTIAPFVFKSLQYTPAPFAYRSSYSAPGSFSYGTQPTPAPFQFSSLRSTPAPLTYNGASFAPEDSFKSIATFYSQSTPATFGIESHSTPAPFVSTSSPVVSVKSHGTIGSQPTSAPFEYSTSSTTPAPFEYGTSSSSAEDSFKAVTTSYTSTPVPFAVESPSTAIPLAFSGLSGAAAEGSFKSINTFGSHSIPAPYSYSQGSAFAQYGGHSAPSPAHEITISREIPVPYYVQIEKRIPYPVLVHIPHPYQVTVEKHVPYAVRVNVDRAVPVPSPYPVEVEKRVPYPVEKPVPYEVRVPVDRPYPVSVPYEKPVPYAVEKPVPYPVRVNVDRPYPVDKPVPYPVPVERPVPYAVEKPVPYPVEKPVPYAVEKQVPYPVKYEVPVNVPVPVEVKVPVNVDRPVPYPVEKKVPYPVAVPYEVKVPVPVQTPAQRFATVHYYQQSPIVVQPESYKSYTSGSTAAPAINNNFVQSSFVSGSGQAGSDYVSPDYTKSDYAGSSLVQDSGSYGLNQQSFYQSTTPVPSSTIGYTASSSSSPQYEPSNFDSIAQQVASIAGSGQAESDYTKSNYAGSGLVQESESYGLNQQSFYGSTTPAPSSTAGYTASSSSPQYESPDFNSVVQQFASIAGSGQAGSDYAVSDYTKSNYAGSGLAQDSGSYSFGQQSFYGSKTPVLSSNAVYTESSSSPQFESSNTDSLDQQVVSIGGSKKTGSDNAGSGYRSNFAGSSQAQESGSYSFGQRLPYGSKIPVSSSKAGYTKASSPPQYQPSNFDSVNRQIESVGGSTATDSNQTDLLDVGKK